MKFKHILFNIITVAALSMNAWADNCELDICVVVPDAVESEISESTAKAVANRLTRALSASGTVADENYGQLYLSAGFSHLYTETLAGPPMQEVVHTQMTVYVADIFGNKVFDSETFDLRGVGSSQQRAFINALSVLNGQNKKLNEFVSRAKQKTMKYFDSNYKSLLQKAERAASMRDYDRALYYTTLIPTCCKGYSEASAATLKYFKAYNDFNGTQLLNKAKAEFAASPNPEGARKAYSLLALIDPDSSAYSAAMKFAEEVKKRSLEEYDFVNHRPYEDAVDLRKQYLNAAKEVGVAYGKGQRDNTTNILWK